MSRFLATSVLLGVLLSGLAGCAPPAPVAEAQVCAQNCFVHGTFPMLVRAMSCEKPTYHPKAWELQGFHYPAGFYCFEKSATKVEPYDPNKRAW